jgi:hypothetical protein
MRILNQQTQGHTAPTLPTRLTQESTLTTPSQDTETMVQPLV